MDAIMNFLKQSGFYMIISDFLSAGGWKALLMIAVSLLLLWLAIKKKFEPLLLIGIAFGMLLTNLPGAEMYHEVLFSDGHVHWDLFGGANVVSSQGLEDPSMFMVLESGDVITTSGTILGHTVESSVGEDAYITDNGTIVNALGEILAEEVNIVIDAKGVVIKDGSLYSGDMTVAKGVYNVSLGLIDLLYLGVKLGIYPCLIFVGIGAMTDFGPLISNPKSLLLGAAAQIGIFATFVGSRLLGFTQQTAGSIGIIGGADGPTAIYTTSILSPEYLGPIAVAAYSYMALVPVIQPPIMKLLTTKKEREIVMKPLRQVSRTEKILFPIVVTIFVALLVPSATPLVGCLMLGNLWKESGVADRLCKTAQNELMNIVTIFLGISVGATATASTFLNTERTTVTIAGKTMEILRLPTVEIIVLGVVAFGVATAGGVLFAKLMNVFSKNKINPLIGSAGVSAVPMAARVSQTVGQKYNPSNFLLMHAMGPNVAGVIGSAIAAGVLIALIPH